MGRDFWLLFGTGLFLNMGLNFSNGLLARYAEVIGIATSSIGFIAGIAFVASLCLKFVSGPLLDSFNRKAIVGAAMAAMALAYLGYANATNEVMLVGASLLRGAAQAFTATGCMIIVGDCLSRDNLARGIGIYSLTMNICHAIGPFTALNLALVIGYQGTFAIAAGFMVIGIALMSATKISSRGTAKLSLSTALQHVIYPPVIKYAAISFCFQAPNMLVVSFLAVFGISRGIPQEHVGLFFAVYAVVLVLIRPKCGQIVDKHGLRKVLVPTLVVFAASFVCLSFVSNLTTLLLVAPLTAIGITCVPLVQAYALKQAPKDMHGAVASTTYIGNDLGSFLGPFLGGVIADTAGYSAMWIAAIAPVAVTIAIAFTLKDE